MPRLMMFVGLQAPKRAVFVRLVPEDSTLGRSVPHWIRGFAVVEDDTAILFPSRAPVYPHGTLEEVLDHELLHLLLYQAAGGQTVPRWFSEGVALVGSRGLSVADRGFALAGGVRGGPVSTHELELYFRGSRQHSQAAYALSGSFVNTMIRRHGRGVVADIAAAMSTGLSFEEAFEHAAGESLIDAERRFFRKSRFLYTWLPWLSSGTGLWLSISALALWARRRTRLRTEAIKKRWEIEEMSPESSLLRREGSAVSEPPDDKPEEEWVN